MKKSRILVLVVTLFLLNSCLSSVSNKMVKKEGMSQEIKGVELLEKAWKAQGMDHLKEHDVYLVNGTDKWKGMMGKMGKVWPEAESDIALRYRVGSFDGQVSLKDGKYEGLKAGLQSWNYYEQYEDEPLEFQKKEDKRLVFGISAFQYFFELLDRLKDAPLITYAGEDRIFDQDYDLVFVTWETLKTHKGHDQYRIWINKKTGMADYCEFTIHDTYLPGGAMIPASIEFAEFKEIGGVQIPHLQYIYLGGPKEKKEKYLHRMTVSSFEFDSFDQEILKPDQNLKEIGNTKDI